MSRWPLVTALVLTDLLLPFAASAESLELSDGDERLGTTDLATWLNRARCVCDEALTASVDVSGLATTGRVALVVGKSCLTSEEKISDSCRSLWGQRVGSGDAEREVSLSAEEVAGDCGAVETTLTLSLLYDADDEDVWTSLAELELGVDTRRPVAPEGSQVVAGEGLAEVAFSASDDDEETDTLRYQVLCTKGGAPGKSSPPSAAFDAASERCGEDGDVELVSANVCAAADEGTASVTVADLEDGERYVFSVVAIDAAGNPSTRVVVGEATPSPEEDLWERYQRSGGAATGCSTTGAPGVEALLLFGGLALVLRRRAR